MTRMHLPMAVAGMLAALPAAAQQVAATTPVEDVVMAVEQRLQDLGYSVSPDGQFDADLRNSVLLYQSDYGLRPTGNVDLETIASLGIDVDPTGMATAQVQARPGDQLAMAQFEEQAAAPREPVRTRQSGVSVKDFDYPLLKDEHMSSPQIPQEIPLNNFENYTGVPQPEAALQEEVAGIPPAYVEQDVD